MLSPLSHTSESPRNNRLTRLCAGVAIAALTFAGIVPAALPAHAAVAAPAAVPAGGSFSSSFEASEPVVALSNQVEVDAEGDPVQENVRGEDSTSLQNAIQTVTASAENGPGESAAKAADGDAGTKWLTVAPTGWLDYQLREPETAVTYSMTSGNDDPTRDPRDWTVSGSTDGVTYVVLDTQTEQSWAAAERGVRRDYTIAAPGEYTHYRLDVTANQSGGIVQLADWQLATAPGDVTETAPITTTVASGPSAGYNMKPQVGFTGVQSLMYSGRHTADGRGYATNRLFDVEVPVGTDSRLTYLIFPALTANDLQYPSTYTAIDLGFTDGTTMSGLEPVDAYDTLATAAGQGSGKILYPNQWNHVQVDLGPIAAGKTVSSIRLSYDNAGATAATAFQGWVDDISIAPAPAAIDGSSLTNYVDTRRGTNSSGAFSRGSNEAITAVPNGFNFLVPVTNALAQSREYSYQAENDDQNRTRFEGLGISHQPSPWMGDRNQFSVMPVDGAAVPSGNPDARAVTFSHDNETAQPDYYGVTLDNGVEAQMTPTNRGGLMRFTLPSGSGSVVLDSPTGDGAFGVDPATGVVSGWIDRAGGFADGQTRMFVSGRFDQLPTATGVAAGGRPLTTFASFATGSVTLRFATSLISLDQAAHNLALEVGETSFDGIRSAANAEWNDRLDVITVEGASETELKTLYGNLYRLNVYPNAQHENVGTAENPEYRYASPVSPAVGEDTATTTGAAISTGKMYVNNGFWDTYRTAWPAYSLLYPDVAAELVDGFTQQYRDGGWIARWSSPGYANIMTGTSSDVAFADAYLRGVDLPDPLATYDAAVKNASTPSASENTGRKSLTTSTFLGYTPATQGESVSWATEGYINDFGIGNMAAALAEDPETPDARRAQLREESEYYLDRATNYINMYDPAIDFLQARNADGSFQKSPEEFDPTAWFGPYTETNGWNFAFHAPQDPKGLENIYGGRAGLENKLDEFFATPETSLGPIHEEVEARDGRFGQWGVSNQVSHHIPFIYNQAGAPAKAQKIVREALQRSFTGTEIGQGYPGDEDNGEMSAWYIFNSLGLYPLQVGSSELVVGSPLFDKATVDLGEGKKLVINAPGNDSKNVYVQSLKVDGEAYSSTSIDSNTLIDGATLDFTLGDQPSSWGTGADGALPSLTEGDDLPDPMVDTADPAISTTTSGGEPAPALVDGSSATEFALMAPEITVGYDGAKQRPAFYTLTASATEADPASWVLEGSDDGVTWTTLDERADVVFANRRETMPFKIADPAAFQRFRFTITGGAPAVSLSEVELLATGAGAVAGELAFNDANSIEATSGIEANLRLGIVSGGATATTPPTATVDWGDGSAAEAAVVGAVKLGNFPVSGVHTYATPGVYRATVTATDGTATVVGRATVTVDYLEPTGLRAAFDSVCIGDDGVGADCDGLGYAYPRAGLADGGLQQGVEASVPGTDLRFTLPVVAAGAPDNATGRGQRILVDLGAGATQLSFIGAATERAQNEVATVEFTDGTTAEVPLQFTDWAKGGNADAATAYGNIEVGRTDYRLSGSGRQDLAIFLYSTAPYDIPVGKTVAAVTLPEQQGSPRSEGRIHLFSIAGNGATAPSDSFAATAGTGIEGVVGDPVEATLASVVQSDAAGAVPKARVQWGDDTITEDAVLTPTTAGEFAVQAVHTYAEPGEYTVSVTVYSASATSQLQLTATISALQPISNTALPRITGSAAVGKTLSADGGSWNAPAPSLTYQWNRDGEPIDGATSAAYRVTAADAGRSLTVTVTASADGFSPASATSTAVVVKKVATSTTGSANRFLSFGGSNLRYSGTVSATGVPVTGTVTIYDGTKAVGTATIEADAAGRFSVALPKLGRGLHLLTARYAGSDQLLGSTAFPSLVLVL